MVGFKKDFTMESKDKFVQQVVQKYEERSHIGIEKYGTTLERNDLTPVEWLNHLQEELMDATLYIQKLKDELPDGKFITKDSWENADKISHDGFVYVKYQDLVFYKEEK
jgi:hypothetical protein